MGDFFTGHEIKPVTLSPMTGTGTQQDFFKAIFNAMIRNSEGWPEIAGLPAYGGDVNAKTNATQQKAWESWAPWMAGESWLATQGGKNWGMDSPDPNLTSMIKQGGTSGPGTQAQSDTMQFGSPSKAIGDWMHNIVQYGSPTAGPVHDAVANLMQYGATGPAGLPLNAQAQGFPEYSSTWLKPFLPGYAPATQPYTAPMIPSK